MKSKKLVANSPCCENCIQHCDTVWCDLSSDELAAISGAKRHRIFAPGEFIYHQGEACQGVYCVYSGLIGDRRLEQDGGSSLVRLNYASSTLGYQEFLTGSEYRNSAEVLQESRVCFIDRSTITRLLASNIALGDRFLQRSLRDLKAIEDSFVVSMKSSVRARLLHVLLVMYQKGEQKKQGDMHILELPVNRMDLAELIGTGPETISRTIRKLHQDDVALFDGRIVRFRNLDAAYNELVIAA